MWTWPRAPRKNRGSVTWLLLYFDRADVRGWEEGRKEECEESPLLSAGSACYLFWKKCAPATPAHAALLHRGQVFQASRHAKRAATSPERSPKRSRSRETASPIVTWAAPPTTSVSPRRASRGPTTRGQFHSWGHALFISLRGFAPARSLAHA